MTQQLLAAEKRALVAQLLQQKREAYSYPLSYGQQALWFFYQSAPDSPAYNMALPLELQGKLNVRTLQQALQALVNRHLTLQTTIELVAGEPRQTVQPGGTYQWAEHHAIEWSEQQLKSALKRAYEHPFDLTQGPVLRADLFQTAPERHILLLTLHHIFGDAGSMAILGQELLTLYQAELTGQRVTLPTLPASYADFVRAETDLLNSSEGEKLAQYWQHHLAGESPLLNLPTDYARPAVQRYKGASAPFSLSAQLSRQLKQLAQQEKTTLFNLLLTAFQILLHRYTGQSEIWVGTPTSTTRLQPQFAHLVGYLVNPVVLRATIDPATGLSFRQRLTQTKQTVSEAIAHSAYPFPLLVKHLRPQRDSSYTPLFQVMLDFQPAASWSRQQTIAGLTVSALELEQMEGQFDLDLTLHEGERITGAFQYNSDLFEPETIERMAGHFQTLLTGIVTDPDQSIAELPILTETERRQILVEWNDTAATYPADKTIHQLFEEQVERTPDNIALVFENKPLSYRELNQRANQLAHHLRTLGVGPEVLVGICMERSLEMMVGLLGILKAGGAYVPLDPVYPKDRLTAMLADAQVTVLVTQEKLVRDNLVPINNDQMTIVYLDVEWEIIAQQGVANLDSRTTPDELAYVIYTSGSTGIPKGVAIRHRSLVNVYCAWEEAYELHTRTSSHLQMASFSFDVFAGDWTRALCSGAKLVLCPREWLLIPAKLYQLMQAEAVDCAEFVPAVIENLIEYLNETQQCLDFMRVLVVGSDSWQMKGYRAVQRFCGRETRLINSYGVTEATIDSCYFEESQHRLHLADERSVPIGRPFNNMQLYILDVYQQPVPIGVVGELYIGGVGVARGYLNRPELTAEKFIPNLFGQGRLYKTGDLARWLPDGNIEFLGRIDHQVKIRGFRIELGEIEAVLGHHPEVQEVVVMARRFGSSNSGAGEQKRLVAYLTPNAPSLFPTLRAYLQQKLPDYMIPAAFVGLDRFPLSPNGKIDRRALPEPDTVITERGYVAPRDPIELRLVQLWENLFHISPIGVQDDFFEIGGDSLLAIRLIARIEQEFGLRISLQTLFQQGTVEQFACLLRQDVSPPPWSPLVCLQPYGSKSPFFCVHHAGGNAFRYVQMAALMGTERPFYAFQPRGVEPGQSLPASIEEMTADYVAAVRNVQPEGPYLLGGWSLGGVIAFEMARLLEQSGETTPFLIMIDAPSPFANYHEEDDIEFLLDRLPLFKGASLEELDLQNSREAQVMYLLKQLKLAGLFTPDIDDTQAQHWFNLYKHLNWLYSLYRPSGPFNGKIIFFKPSEKIPFDTQMGDPIPAWERFARAGIEVYETPGNHFDMVSPANTPALVKQMKDCMERLEREGRR